MADIFTLTAEQRQQFLDDGLVRAPAAVSTETVETMADRIWRTLERQLGAVRDRPETWPRQGKPDFKAMSNAGVFAAMLSPTVRALLDDVFFGRAWSEPALPPRPLGVTFPTPDRPWSVPTLHWHVDRVGSDLRRPADVADRAWPASMRLFACLAPVRPRGGGTLYVAGSHRAANLVASEMRPGRERIPSAMLVQRLKDESPWLAELCSRGEETPGRADRFMHQGGLFRDIPLRVGEMTGEAGDVLLWHPNVLHTFAPSSAGPWPRIVLSVTIDVAEA